VSRAIRPNAIDYTPYISPDESFLLFSSNRPLNGDKEEVFVHISFRKSDGTWSAPQRASQVPGRFPSLSPDGKYLFFCGDDGYIYWADKKILDPFRRDSVDRRTDMLLSLFVTVLPVLFLAGLIQKGLAFRRRHVDMDGVPPIPKALFASSKWAIVVVWGAMVIQSWSDKLSFIDVPVVLTSASLGLWALGFALLFAGRAGLGDSFRIGSPKEPTGLKRTGLFRFSRNPMYVGVYATLCAAVLRTLNPILLLIAVYVIAVHHRIVLAEETQLRRVFGEGYRTYCSQVRRYL
jgi:protein-S-isoprenylcysteine O-methyltransferase Ste14